MTMQTIQGGLVIPAINNDFSTTPVLNSSTAMNDANDAVGWVFAVPKAGNIRYVGFRTATVTTGDTLKVSLYTTDATTGFPTTTAYKGMVAGTQVVGNADDNVWFTVQLSTDATSVVAGDIIAAVLEFNSFVAGNLGIAYEITNAGQVNFPYDLFFEAAWAKQGGNVSVFYIKYDDGTVAYIPNALPLTTSAQQNFQVGTTPDEYALRFKLPFPARVAGVVLPWVCAGDTKIILYDSDGTSILTSVTFDKDYYGNTSIFRFAYRFSSPQTILKDTFYRLSIQPQAASNTSIVIWTAPEAVALDQMEGGQNFHLSTRTDAGAWDDTATNKRPMISLILDQFDDGTAVGGGLLTHPGMAGGMRA